MTDLRQVAADLRAEQDALDAIVADLSDQQWRLATPSPGWTVSD
ncbi:MAG: maleylpyruvate isomerase N-terminal domain-containing protein, partial [Acidimicrobiales bacterium]